MRRVLDQVVGVLAASCALMAIGILGLIVAAIVRRGGATVSWEFLTGQMRLVGAAGGIVYNLAGTLILIGTALMVSLPVGMGIALLHGVYVRGTRARERLWMLLSVLNGMPTILLGLFGLLLFVKLFGWGKSWLAGGLLLGVMMLPTVSMTLMERIQALPRKYLEAAAALGLRESQIVWSVILPQCANGLVTGALLGLARAAGETAPIMFTATIFAGATLPQGIKESPVLSLPYHIFVLSQDTFDPAAAANVWGAALVLLGLVFSLSLAALPARLRIHEEARHG